MTDNPETTESQTQPTKAANPKRTTIIIAVILVLAIFFWLYASKLFAVNGAQREGVRAGAVALAAATVPLIDLRSKDLLGDDATLQRVVDEIAESNRFSFVAILDTQGRVLAASDRNTSTGAAYPDFKSGQVVERGVDGKYEVIQPIRQDTVVYGAVVLRFP